MRSLSVIVAAYNAERYIDRCLRSILSQGVGAEVVVVDDGSTDRTPTLLAAYGGQIRVVTRARNGGSVSLARNLGLDTARGELITFCDADDWYPEGALRSILELQRETGADIVRFSYVRVFPDGREKLPQSRSFQAGLVEKEDFPRLIYPHFICGFALNSVWGAVIKREIVEDIRFPVRFKTAEDAAFSLQVYTKAGRVLLCPQAFYCYYQHRDSLTGRGLALWQKYRCNFLLTGEILRLLPRWGMDTPLWRLRAALRPLRLTGNKIRRMRR